MLEYIIKPFKIIKNISDKAKDKIIESSLREYPKMSMVGKTLCWHFYGNCLNGQRQEELAKHLDDNPINYSLAGLYGNIGIFNSLKIFLGFEALKLSYDISGGLGMAVELGAKGFFIYAGLGITESIGRRIYIGITNKPIAQIPAELGWKLKDLTK